MSNTFPRVQQNDLRCLVFMKSKGYDILFFEMKNGHKYSVLLNTFEKFCLDLGFVDKASKVLEKNFEPILISGMPAFAYKHEHSTPL
jgi:hypothetical protein